MHLWAAEKWKYYWQIKYANLDIYGDALVPIPLAIVMMSAANDSDRTNMVVNMRDDERPDDLVWLSPNAARHLLKNQLTSTVFLKRLFYLQLRSAFTHHHHVVVELKVNIVIVTAAGSESVKSTSSPTIRISSSNSTATNKHVWVNPKLQSSNGNQHQQQQQHLKPILPSIGPVHLDI